tara:strand:- start:301 stop:456 length:156 start_codon:yes stop_codon:yes gene_type:complete
MYSTASAIEKPIKSGIYLFDMIHIMGLKKTIKERKAPSGLIISVEVIFSEK